MHRCECQMALDGMKLASFNVICYVMFGCCSKTTNINRLMSSHQVDLLDQVDQWEIDGRTQPIVEEVDILEINKWNKNTYLVLLCVIMVCSGVHSFEQPRTEITSSTT